MYIPQKTIAIVNPQINELKIQYFGTRHVEIKSDWLRNPILQKKMYLEKYTITLEELKKFVDAWYNFFKAYKEIQIQAFILDKRCYKKNRNNYSPLQIATQILFDRVELHPRKDCSIVFDQMDNEIKSVNHQQGKIIKISNKEIDLGSFHTKYSHTTPIFEKSKDSNFLQLADTVAYNVLRQFIDYGDNWDAGAAQRFKKMYPFFARTIDNFYRKNGKVAGFGIVKTPDMMKKTRWEILPKKTPY